MYVAILWQGAEVNVLIAEGGGEQRVSGTCIVAYQGFEVIPGILAQGATHFGWWPSTVSTDPLTAWRAGLLLAKVEQLRHGQTIGELVYCLQGKGAQEQLKSLCEDFGLTTEGLAEELLVARKAVPTPEELETMLLALAGKVESWSDPYTQYLEPIMQLEAQGMEVTEWTASLLRETRRLQEEERLRQESIQQEIERPVPPEESLGLLLLDLGVVEFRNPTPQEGKSDSIDAATLDRMVKEMAFGLYQTRLLRLVLPPGKQVFSVQREWMRLIVAGREITIRWAGYVPDNDTEKGNFRLEMVVVGREVREGTLTVLGFRELIEKLRGFPLPVGTQLFPPEEERPGWWRR